MFDTGMPLDLQSLDMELILLIFQSFRRGYATGCLCRLEQTCKSFSAPGQLDGEEEGLSLPELAARLLMARALALPVRPDGLKPIRPYERGPGEATSTCLSSAYPCIYPCIYRCIYPSILVPLAIPWCSTAQAALSIPVSTHVLYLSFSR